MSRLMLNQKMIWTSTGVPRKNQMYAQLTLDSYRVCRQPHDREHDAEEDADRPSTGW